MLILALFAANAQKKAKPIKLFIEAEQISELQKMDPQLCRFVVGDKVKVNNKVCDVLANNNGALYVEADYTKEGIYKAVYPADVTSDQGDAKMLLVPSQLHRKSSFERIYLPMRAEKAVDGKLTLNAVCGVLHLRISGEASVNCIKLEDNSGAPLAGYFNFDAQSGTLMRSEASSKYPYGAVIDCSNTGEGVMLNAMGEDFYAILPVGEYKQGVKITISDRKHHTMEYKSEPFDIKRGKVTSIAQIAYQYPTEQLFSEKFDNMVYGGNVMGGKECGGFTPASEGALIDATYNGTERAVYRADYKSAGSDYMQRNWKTAPVDDGSMCQEYLANRNLSKYKSLLRAQEYYGYLGVGVKEYYRGTFTTPAFKEIKDISDIEVSFKFATELNPTCEYKITISNAGVIKEYWVDGVKHTLSPNNYPYKGSQSETITLTRRSINLMPIPEGAAQPWHEIRFVVSGATAKTSLSIIAEKNDNKQRNGFYIDDIEVKLLNHYKREERLRVMCYNIQNGMWADQANNYDNFVKYMQEEDIDIAIFCEASTIYHNHTKERSPYKEHYLPYKYLDYAKGDTSYRKPEGWIELAARYGHNYAEIGAHQDNYPVVVTSKYPIVFAQQLGGSEVSHGGIHAQIEVDGEIINIVGFHTWPQAWRKGVSKEERLESGLNYEGHQMRRDEIKIFMDRTIHNPKFADQKHWIVTGDMNCYSPLDDLHFDVGYMHPRYLGQRYLLEEVPQIKDLIKTYGCPDKRDVLIPSTMRGGRIDFIYGSERFVNTMTKAKSPKSGFTNGTHDKTTNFFKNRGSDHLPLIVDFKWR